MIMSLNHSDQRIRTVNIGFPITTWRPRAADTTDNDAERQHSGHQRHRLPNPLLVEEQLLTLFGTLALRIHLCQEGMPMVVSHHHLCPLLPLCDPLLPVLHLLARPLFPLCCRDPRPSSP